MPIRHYLDDNTVFEPDAIKAMSEALERACAALHVNGQAHDREVIAERIIALARRGVTDAKALADRVIAETKVMPTL
jgi:hypothetical protein